MLPNKQSAKGATFALLATMLRGWFRETMESFPRKKEISFRENFWPGKPRKTVISPISETMKNGRKALYYKGFHS